MSKERGKTPSLISGSNGKPSYTVTQRVSKCTRCGATINGGSRCIVIPRLGGPFTIKKRVCLKCFKTILDQTKLDLEILEKSLT